MDVKVRADHERLISGVIASRKGTEDRWMLRRGDEGHVFRAVSKARKAWGRGISENVVWYVVWQWLCASVWNTLLPMTCAGLALSCAM